MNDALSDLEAAFAETVAPPRWDRGTCSCAECVEHTQTLEKYRHGNLDIGVFRNAAWDPMTVANDDAFRYFIPRLMRLAAAHPEYLEQLLFHITVPGRLDGISGTQARALMRSISALMDANPTLLEPPLVYRTGEALRLVERASQR